MSRGDQAENAEAASEGAAERWSRWMGQAQQGDREAYRRLMGELHDWVGRYATRMLRDSVAADDCAQDALLALHRARHTYDPRRPFRPWLLAIVRRKVFDVARHRERRRENPLDEEAAALRPVESDPTTQRDLERLLERLPPKYREAVLLTKIEGLAGREAASAIGISQISLRTRVHRGLKQLESLARREGSLDEGNRV
ncbi:MAG: RNA polymerase sigma factor [Myxococcota bacterium]